MISTAQQLVQQGVVFCLASILLGGTVGLLLLGKQVPEFLVGFDGVIVTAAFANGGFFALARSVMPTHLALVDLAGKYHELAVSATKLMVLTNHTMTKETTTNDAG